MLGCVRCRRDEPVRNAPPGTAPYGTYRRGFNIYSLRRGNKRLIHGDAVAPIMFKGTRPLTNARTRTGSPRAEGRPSQTQRVRVLVPKCGCSFLGVRAWSGRPRSPSRPRHKEQRVVLPGDLEAATFPEQQRSFPHDAFVPSQVHILIRIHWCGTSR